MGDLLRAGAPWDALDERGHSAGSHALANKHDRVYKLLVESGASAVLREENKGGGTGGHFCGENERYLAQVWCDRKGHAYGMM